jgi:hypothetical protein
MPSCHFNWIWLPHAAHFIGGDKCRFRLATVVGKEKKFIVSTIGEYVPCRETQQLGAEENSFYETCVFPAIKITNDCCEYEAEVMEVLETKRTGTPKLSKKIHLEMCEKYDKKVKE